MIDVPPCYSSLKAYRATLAHKANHRFARAALGGSSGWEIELIWGGGGVLMIHVRTGRVGSVITSGSSFGQSYGRPCGLKKRAAFVVMWGAPPLSPSPLAFRRTRCTIASSIHGLFFSPRQLSLLHYGVKKTYDTATHSILAGHEHLALHSSLQGSVLGSEESRQRRCDRRRPDTTANDEA